MKRKGLTEQAAWTVGRAIGIPSADSATATAEELIAFCRGKVASFKIPRHVIFQDALPMTASGKIRRVELRDAAVRQLAEATA